MSDLNECGQLCTFTQDRDFSDAVLNQTEHVLTDPLFSHSPQLKRFLRFAVAKTLAGEGQKLKEYTIAVEALGKPETFDPRLDSIVRVEARRLRNKLHLYYSTRGSSDDIFIRFEQGHYVPKVAKRSLETLPAERDAPRVGIREAPPGHADELISSLRSLGFPYKKLAHETGDGVPSDFDVTIVCADCAQALESCLDHTDRGTASAIPLVLALSYDTLRECAAVACSGNTQWIVLPARPVDVAAAIHIAIAQANVANSVLPARVSAASSAA
jgi:hypothetical protein